MEYYATKYNGRFPLYYQHMLVLSSEYYGIDENGVAIVLEQNGGVGSTYYDIRTLREGTDGDMRIDTVEQKSTDIIKVHYSASEIYQMIKDAELNRHSHANYNELKNKKFLAVTEEMTKPAGTRTDIESRLLVDEDFLKKLKKCIPDLLYDDSFIYMGRYIIRFKDKKGNMLRKLEIINEIASEIDKLEKKILAEEEQIDDFFNMYGL